jgi:hypothetical protein
LRIEQRHLQYDTLSSDWSGGLHKKAFDMAVKSSETTAVQIIMLIRHWFLFFTLSFINFQCGKDKCEGAVLDTVCHLDEHVLYESK